MTCIVGVEHDGRVYLAGDSIAINGDMAFLVADPKVFLKDAVAIGFAGSFRGGQLLRYGFTAPRHVQGKSDMEYLVVDFVDALRAALKKKGFVSRENDVEEIDMALLLGYNGHLYKVDADMQVTRSQAGYNAIGSGEDVALGALAALEQYSPGLSPEERLVASLTATAHRCTSVRGPFNVVCLDTRPTLYPRKQRVRRDEDED